MADQITREEFADHMDAFEQRLGARISRTDRRLETVDSRLDAIDGRLDTIDARLDVIDGYLRGISERLTSRAAGDVESAIDSPQPVPFPPSGTSIERPLPGLEVMLVTLPDGVPSSRADDAPAARLEVHTGAEMSAQPRLIRKGNGSKVKSARGGVFVAPKRSRQRRRT